jgi:CheY-like chemotaxis protein
VPYQLLLADSSVTIQRVIRLTLADEDVDVTTVSDGNQAISMIDGAPPDIVLADIRLPGRTGYDLAQHLRDTPGLARIPVILLTDVFSKFDEARAVAVGCDRILSKPFDPEVVIACVRELLTQPKKGVGAQASPEAVKPMAIDVSPSADMAKYFDRLDMTFAGLATAPFPLPGVQADSLSMQVDPLSIEVVDLKPDIESPGHVSGVALSYGSDRAAFDHPLGATPESSAPEWPGESRAAGSPSLSPVGDAQAPIISDDLVDELASRVLDRLMARLSAGAVPDIVTAVAERLVRAEIDNIKSRL